MTYKAYESDHGLFMVLFQHLLDGSKDKNENPVRITSLWAKI